MTNRISVHYAIRCSFTEINSFVSLAVENDLQQFMAIRSER
jgi:hypothetical protein